MTTSVLRTGDALPTQAGQAGKYLGTNGTSASWQAVDALPAQTSASGKFLTTDGTTASWASVPQSGPPGPFIVRAGYTTAGHAIEHRAVEIDEDGNTYIGFVMYPGATDEYAGVCKVSASGAVLWRATWGGPSSSAPHRVDDLAVGDGYVYVLDFDSNGFDHYVTVLNATDGSWAWSKQLPWLADTIVANNHGHVMVFDQNMTTLTIFDTSATDVMEYTITCPSDALGYAYAFTSKAGDFYMLPVNDSGTPELWRIYPNGAPVLVTADVGVPANGVYGVAMGGDGRLYVRQAPGATATLNCIDLETGASHSYFTIDNIVGEFGTDPSGGVIKYWVTGSNFAFQRVSDRGIAASQMRWRLWTDDTRTSTILMFDEASNRQTSWSPHSIALRAGYNDVDGDTCALVAVLPANLTNTLSDATIPAAGYSRVFDNYGGHSFGLFATAPSGGTATHVFTESPTYATYLDATPTITLNDAAMLPVEVTLLTTGPMA